LQTKHFLISFTSPSLSLQTRSNFSFLLQQKNYAYETSEISRENFRVKSQQGSEGPNGFEVVLSLSISLVEIPSPEHFVFFSFFLSKKSTCLGGLKKAEIDSALTYTYPLKRKLQNKAQREIFLEEELSESTHVLKALMWNEDSSIACF
jgi:hypothetical protein